MTAAAAVPAVVAVAPPLPPIQPKKKKKKSTNTKLAATTTTIPAVKPAATTTTTTATTAVKPAATKPAPINTNTQDTAVAAKSPTEMVATSTFEPAEKAGTATRAASMMADLSSKKVLQKDNPFAMEKNRVMGGPSKATHTKANAQERAADIRRKKKERLVWERRLTQPSSLALASGISMPAWRGISMPGVIDPQLPLANGQLAPGDHECDELVFEETTNEGTAGEVSAQELEERENDAYLALMGDD